MKYLRIFFRIAPRVAWNWLFYVRRYARHPERYPIEKRYFRVRQAIRLTVDQFHLDVRMEGLEKLFALQEKGESFLIISNHLSDFDPLALIYWSEKPLSFVGKVEVRKFPFIGTASAALGGFFMDRDDLRQSLKVMRSMEEKLQSEPTPFLIYAEGTRNRKPWTPTPDFHPGSFKSAMRISKTILPMAIFGTQRPLSMHSNYKRYPVEMTFFDPITPADYEGLSTVELSVKTHELIANEVKKMQDEDREFFLKGYQRIPFKKGKVR